MRIVMITATPQSVAEGSGTFVAQRTISQGLRALGHDVRVVCPERASAPLGYTFHRFRFNGTLAPRAVDGADLVIGWDMDGYRLAGRIA
ncbi:MAG: glycosyltransferase family 1 protein, partial [Gemmatimonadales bacterium]|nr:glycosyltransferase family 1 protein [Gemmatimonadales bacterium]